MKNGCDVVAVIGAMADDCAIVQGENDSIFAKEFNSKFFDREGAERDFVRFPKSLVELISRSVDDA